MQNDALENRVNELEVRLSFQDATIAELDSVIRAQAVEIAQLKARLEKLASIQENPGGVEATHEKPPHY